MTRHFIISPLTAATALLSAGMALAEQSPPPAPAAAPPSPTAAFMKTLDKNNDQQVSLDEAIALQSPRFQETDADHSGSISIDEARNAFTQQVPPDMLKQMRERGMPDPGETFVKNLDKNNDNAVDLKEFEQPAIDSFKRMDSDQNGMATAEEATAFFNHMQQQMQERMQQMQQRYQEMNPAPSAPAPTPPAAQ